MASVTLQVAFNPTTRVALVQTTGTAIPGGSVNAGTFTHQIPAIPERGDVQRVLFHGVRDVLYFRKASGQPGFFPENITTLQGIDVQADANVPRALMGENEEPPAPEPPALEPVVPEPVVPPPAPPPEPEEPPAP
jgi:hypothetical protein